MGKKEFSTVDFRDEKNLICAEASILPIGFHLNCLLYAHGLVLISHSAKGLENALSILSKYCDNWLLSVNPKKTKVMIFQKKYRKSVLDKFHFQTSQH